jgi:hypothetical protein
MTTSATGETTPKRARTDPESASTSSTKGTLSHYFAKSPAIMAADPTEDADDDIMFMDTTNPSLPREDNRSTDQKLPAVLFSFESLPDALQKLSSTYEKEFVRLMMDKRARSGTLIKLKKPAFIPKSINLNFTFRVSKTVKDSDEFAAIDIEANQCITKFQEDMKTHLVQVGTLEIQRTEREINLCFFKALVGFSRLILLDQNYQDENPPTRNLALLCLEDHGRGLIRHLSFDAPQIFETFHETADADNELYLRGTLSADFRRQYSKAAIILTSLMHELYVTRWTTKLASMAAKEKANALEQARKAILKEDITAATATAMNFEDTVDKSTIGDLINDALAQKFKPVKTQLSRLEQQISRTSIQDSTDTTGQKNSRRGTPSRASLKKTNTKPATESKPATKVKARKKTPSPARNRDSADGDARDSSPAPTKGRQKKQKPKPSNKPPNKNTVRFKK